MSPRMAETVPDAAANPRFRIAFAGLDDLPDCALILDDMHRHYRGEGGVQADLPAVETIEAEARRWLTETEGTRLLLAREAETGVPAALACLAVLRPGRALRGLVFVKDLYVAASARRQGAGRATLAWILAWARRENLGRVDLTTDVDNAPARALYASLGGVERPEAVFLRFDLA
ncbi:MAG: GNAT family N-acetyltransferase [Pseudomonadota bacterium]